MANLTPEQLAAMQRDRQAGYYDHNGNWISQSGGGVADPANGDMFIGNYNASGMSPELMALAGRAPDSQYTYGTGGVNGSGQIGDQYGIYTGKGEDTGQTGTYSSTTDADMWKTLATYVAILGGAGAAGGMFAGAGVPGIGGAAGGPGSAGWGMGLDSMGAGSGALEAMGGASGMGAAGGGGMVNGAFLGEAPWAATGGADAGLLNGLNGSDLMSDAFVSNGGHGGGGFGGTSGGYLDNVINGSGGNGLSSLFGDGAGGTVASAAAGAAKNPILGLGATAIGGLLGSQGQQKEQSETRDIPPWLKPYAEKVIGLGSGLLDQQMAPGAMQGYEDMKRVGQGLLNRPVMGNGFERLSQFGSGLLGQQYPQLRR